MAPGQTLLSLVSQSKGKGPSCLSPGLASSRTRAPGFAGAAPSAQDPLPKSSFFSSTGTQFGGQEPPCSRHPLS